MQLGVDGASHVNNLWLFGIFGHIIKDEGIFGLHRDILHVYYNVVFRVWIVFITYENSKNSCQAKHQMLKGFKISFMFKITSNVNFVVSIISLAN